MVRDKQVEESSKLLQDKPGFLGINLLSSPRCRDPLDRLPRLHGAATATVKHHLCQTCGKKLQRSFERRVAFLCGNALSFKSLRDILKTWKQLSTSVCSQNILYHHILFPNPHTITFVSSMLVLTALFLNRYMSVDLPVPVF